MLDMTHPMRRAPVSLPTSVPFALTKILTAGAVIGVTTTLVLGGCGSRGPLDDGTNPNGSGTGNADAEADAATAIDAAPEAATPTVDAGREASAIGCGICVIGQCS